MDDDINTPKALAVIFELSREINRAKELGTDTTNERTVLKKLTGLLGLTLESKSDTNLEVAPFVDLILDIREELRNNKQWDLSSDSSPTVRVPLKPNESSKSLKS